MDEIANIATTKMSSKGRVVILEDIREHRSALNYIHEGLEAPKECPACAHLQAFYELLGENC